MQDIYADLKLLFWSPNWLNEALTKFTFVLI